MLGKSSTTKFANIIACVILLLMESTSFAQVEEDSTKVRRPGELRGYLKYMQTTSFTVSPPAQFSDHLLHNRLNFRFYPAQKMQAAIEFRNRVFYGETVKSNPSYGALLDNDPGLADLSWLLVDNPAVVALVQADRLWLQWADDKWMIRAGRQRINWGMNIVWNANDLFNAYSLVDFDYEERPGSDAIRVQRRISGMSDIELAVAPGSDSKKWIGAMKYTFNKRQYDWQLLAGNYKEDIALGVGWAGNLKLAGFKGEATWFQPKDASLTDTIGVLSASAAVDYVFGNGLYVLGGVLYNSIGINDRQVTPQNIFSAPLSAKNLMPSRFSFIGQGSASFTPLTNAAMVVLYSPGINALFLMPSVSHSIHQGWDLAMFGQLIWMDSAAGFGNLGNGIFLRLKRSF